MRKTKILKHDRYKNKKTVSFQGKTGFKAGVLTVCFLITGCQTVTISNKPAKFKESRQTTSQSGHKRYSKFARRFIATASQENRISKKKKTSKIKVTSAPHKTLNQDFYLLGLLPRIKTINLSKVCQGRTVSLIQTLFTWKNFLVGVATFGIVSPRTAKIWC